MDTYSPIVLFVYNRPNKTRNVLDTLRENRIVEKSDLYIFSDAARDISSQKDVEIVRSIIHSVSGFKSITIIENETNKGLAKSVIEGVSFVIKRYKKVIVLEDDLICMPNFLSYMNQALDFYKDDERIFSICGYGFKIKKPHNYKYNDYMFGRSSSWGWGTWADRWEKVDWEIKDWEIFTNDTYSKRKFNKNGSDMYSMLKDYMERKNNSWAIRFCYTQFKLNKYSIFPFLSKIDNKGFGSDGTNCKQVYSRFKTLIDNTIQDNFVFSKDIVPDKNIIKSCSQYNSGLSRMYSKIRQFLNTKGIR